MLATCERALKQLQGCAGVALPHGYYQVEHASLTSVRHQVFHVGPGNDPPFTRVGAQFHQLLVQKPQVRPQNVHQKRERLWFQLDTQTPRSISRPSQKEVPSFPGGR